jgi:serine/threonine protein kinase
MCVYLRIGRYHKDVDSDHLEVGAKDSIIMEALTKSPYIANVYGYCGMSQMVEYSNGGELKELIQENYLAEEDAIDPIDNLKISIQVASAISDLHDESISVIHGDLSVDQIILIDGIYKLNDFHLSEFLYWNLAENKTSKDRIGFVKWVSQKHNASSSTWYQ